MKEDSVKIMLRAYGVLMAVFLATLTLTGCQAVTSRGVRSTVIIVVISSIATTIVGLIGYLLGLIPVIGVVFKWITIIAISIRWILFLSILFISYGFLSVIIGIIIGIPIAIVTIGGILGGSESVVGILIFWK